MGTIRDPSTWLVSIPARLVLLVGLVAPSVVGSVGRGDDKTQAAAAETFKKDVLPLLQARCFSCHGPTKRKAGLDLRTLDSVRRGGDSGPAVVRGSLEASPLWDKISTDLMPPGKTKLSAAEKAVIQAWLEKDVAASTAPTGVKFDPPDRRVTDEDRQFWSFRAPVRPPVPTVQHQDRVRNSVDAFILAALEKKGLALAPEADRLTLLRRATFDLTGLPPTPQEIDAFLNDPAADAYERIIDRLLSSTQYGERWGRHWLDLAGYADSEGVLDMDTVRSAAWRYRDYVIRSFNKDKPYDRFLKEQLAGDELTDYWSAYRTQQELSPEVVDGLVATGYLRCAPDASRPELMNVKNAAGYYFQTLDDTVKIVCSSVLGLTVECARCHTHKYDPIPQTDYYRIQAVFMSAYRPSQWVAQPQRRLLEVTAAGEKAGNVKVSGELARLRKQAEDLRKEYAGFFFTGRLGKLPEQIREDVRTALNTPPAKRTEVQKYLAAKFEKDLRPDPATLGRRLPEMFVAYKVRAKQIEDALRGERSRATPYPEIRALYDVPGEAKTYLLRRGEYTLPGQEVQPGAVAALATPKPFGWSPPAKDAKTSGRRLAFAQWLTEPSHPLTARVLVNRLWFHHFGEGIVTTPDNFGHMGARPTHPELLDWLATEFVARGWSIKAMHRLVMNSSTYRQVASLDPAAAAVARRVDPEDRLLWRQRLRRLEAEEIRDTVLSVAGDLNPEQFGPPVPVQRQPDGEVTPPADPAGRRRSVYLLVRRSQPLTLLQTFDQPVMETNCTRRSNSTVAPQALTLLNSDFMIQQAELFADRVLKEKPDDPATQAVRVAFGRPPRDKERAALGSFLEAQTSRHAAAGPAVARRQAVADLCHMLLTANEFIYVD